MEVEDRRDFLTFHASVLPPVCRRDSLTVHVVLWSYLVRVEEKEDPVAVEEATVTEQEELE